MKITAVKVDTLELQLGEPFVIASSALSVSPCALVRVHTDEGLEGLGEACPAYEFTGDTLWSVEDVIGEYLAPSVIGRDPFDIEAIVTTWQRELYTVGNQAAQAGLEMALWDLQGKALGRPLHDLIGGRMRPAFPEVCALGWDDPVALAIKARRLRDEGVSVFKVKVGDAPERDEQRVAAVRDAIGPRCRLTVDANQGWWDARTAVRAIRRLEPYALEYVEQPVRMDDLAAARFVRERVDVPVALDESVRGPREALACVQAGACDILVVKLMKTGGILNALRVNAIAEAAGVTVTMGNMGESTIGLAAHFHVHQALANCVHCDADLPWRPGGLITDIAEGLRGETVEGVARVSVSEGAGLGVTLLEAGVEEQRVTRPWVDR